MSAFLTPSVAFALHVGSPLPAVITHPPRCLIKCESPPETVVLVWAHRENVKVLVPQSFPTLCHPMDCSLPGSSVHGIL